MCYGRPLLQAWLLPDLDTIPNNCVKKNSLSRTGYGTGFSSRHPWFKSRPALIFLHLFICFFVTDFVRKKISYAKRDFRTYCGQCTSRSDCTLGAVWSWSTLSNKDILFLSWNSFFNGIENFISGIVRGLRLTYFLISTSSGILSEEFGRRSACSESMQPDLCLHPSILN